MYVKNYTNTDFSYNGRGNSITLAANAITLIPDGLVTIQELQKMFGLTAVALATTGPSTTILNQQQVCSVGKLYLTDPHYPIDVRLFVGVSGSINVYGSDSATPPTATSTMDCPEENQNVTGMADFQVIPRYLAFKNSSGTPEIIIYGCKLYEVGNIA